MAAGNDKESKHLRETLKTKLIELTRHEKPNPPPHQTKTLGQICIEGGIPFPMTEVQPIKVEIGCTIDELGGEEIVRNFPERSYSVASKNPNDIVNLLAHEAHEWRAVEINRVRNRQKRRFELLTSTPQ